MGKTLPTNSKLRATLLASIAIVSFSAFPASADAVTDGFIAALSAANSTNEAKAEFVDVSGDADKLTVGALRLTFPADADLPPFELKNVVFTGIKERDGGGYEVGSIDTEPFSITTEKDGPAFTIGAGHAEGVIVPADDETDPILMSGYFKSSVIDGITITADGSEFMTMGRVEGTMADYVEGGVSDASFKILDVKLDPSQMKDPKAKQMFADLGYETLTGEMGGAGIWDPSSGVLDMKSIKFVVNDAASLDISFGITGYTKDLALAIDEMNKGDGDPQAKSMAMLGLLQQLNVAGATVTLTDDSITDKVLTYMGKQQGVDRDGMAAFAKGMVPMGLAQLQMPEFAAQATAAISAFLDKPGTLELKAAPPAPVPVMQLMPALMGAPQTLITTLNVGIEAK